MTGAVRREKVASVRVSSVSEMVTPSSPPILLASACHLEKEKVITMVMVSRALKRGMGVNFLDIMVGYISYWPPCDRAVGGIIQLLATL